jgi:large subunit ribosomal protein L6
MSRIGRRPIPIPAGVDFKAEQDGTVTVKGPKGILIRKFHPDIQFRLEEGVLYVERPTEEKMHRSLHGLSRTLVANMVQGVTTGYTRELEIQGVGFRAQMNGPLLQINVGFSHSIEVLPREGISFSVANDPQSRNPVITITGIDKELVGRTAAEIRKLRKPEPYKGKGIRYKGERVRRKQGKAGGKGGGKKK